MASAEQPLKKRKLYEAPPPPPPQPPPPPPPPPPPSHENDEAVVAPPLTPQPLSHEEIHRRRRYQEEIRSVYENYKTIKRCISGKDARHMPELEQAYLSLISASRGCASVQRILSEFIPKYASYCPTALEAAAQVVINMHNWNVPVISRGEDVDEVSFETVKNCIVGLVDICCTASLEAPSSSVIRGICSAVFIDVATFFASSVEGRDIFQIINKESLKVQDSVETFAYMKQKVLEEDTCVSDKLLKFRALCFLRIFFVCPKDLLAACFELFSTNTADGLCREGKYFLSQLSSTVCIDDEAHFFNVTGACDGPEASTSDMVVDGEKNDISHRRPGSDRDNLSENEAGLLKSCLLGLVLHRNPSLKKWIFSRYQRLRKTASSEAVSQVTTAFEGIFESFTELLKVQDSIEDSDEDVSDSSNYISRQYLVHRISDQRGAICEVSGKETMSQVHDKSCKDELPNKIAGQYLKHHGSLASLESDRHSNTSSNHDSGGSKGLSFDGKEQGDRCPVWSPMPKDFCSDRLLSPGLGKASDIKAEPFELGDHIGKNQASNASSLRFSGGLAGNATFGSSPAASYPSQSSHIVWYSDGDPAAMDVLSASRLLWLGSLAPDASEAAARFEFERFGPLDNFSFFPATRFALVEYKSIRHAIKAREFFRRYSPWGHPVRIKFIDIGLGTRGAVNGVAIGSSCHVFVGNVLSQWVKDEIMCEMMKAIRRGPRLVSELTSEGALLLEFETPEEAANAMACLRQLRRGNNNFTVPVGAGLADISRPRPSFWNSVPTPISNAVGNVGNTLLGSPDIQTAPSPSNRIHNAAVHFEMKPEGIPPEFASPRSSFEHQALTMRGGQVTQSHVTVSGYADMPSTGSSKGPSEQMWVYRKPELELQSAAVSVPCAPMATQGPPFTPPPPIQAPPCVRPVYPPPSSSWDAHGFSHHMPLNSIPPRVMPTNIHSNAIPSFVQASVTPLSQIPGSAVQPYSQMVPQHIVPPFVPLIPPTQHDMPPPLPPSPLMVPPPPSSPPPPPPPPANDPVLAPPNTKPSSMGPAGGSLQIQWQGTLSKSGVHYCNIYANRVDSDICTYAISLSEPVGWPAKLDMTKRTDFRHVKATFTNTPPHRREVCQLVPSSAADQKGFQDFISYLKQRECAGVIKIPATKTLWARLLFILPYSLEVCSMLSINSKASDGLIAVVLPKEANLECS